jgi:pyruvate/2-oxoglutarate dehydrogenase complex dihydrolipoamide dehydrogenase (E3) component
MADSANYDAIIIGAGQAGGPLATALAETGRTVAIIEREHVGGTCINVGCTPTKTMIASARAAYVARRGADYGVHTGSVTVDQTVVRQRKRNIVESWRASRERSRVETPGIDLIYGEAMFVAPTRIRVVKSEGETS